MFLSTGHLSVANSFELQTPDLIYLAFVDVFFFFTSILWTLTTRLVRLDPLFIFPTNSYQPHSLTSITFLDSRCSSILFRWSTIIQLATRISLIVECLILFLFAFTSTFRRNPCLRMLKTSTICLVLFSINRRE